MEAKTVTLILVLFVIQFYKANTEDIEYSPCLSSEGVTPEEELEFVRSDLTSTDINPKFKCLAACYLEEMNALDNCTFNYEAVGHLYSDEEEEEEEEEYYQVMAAEACKDSAEGSDRCECGFNVYKCIADFDENSSY